MSEKTVKIWRGKKKYQHTSDFEIEMLKLERLLDSVQHRQKVIDKKISQALGISRMHACTHMKAIDILFEAYRRALSCKNYEAMRRIRKRIEEEERHI